MKYLGWRRRRSSSVQAVSFDGKSCVNMAFSEKQLMLALFQPEYLMVSKNLCIILVNNSKAMLIIRIVDSYLQLWHFQIKNNINNI